MQMRVYFPGGKQVHADLNGMTIRTDQPPSAGGNGSAPSPFELFLASLGTCAGIYVLGFCQQRGIDTTGLELVQSMQFDAATRLVSTVNLEIKLPHGFPEKYREALIQAAKLCTVKKQLENAPQVNVFVTAPS